MNDFTPNESAPVSWEEGCPYSEALITLSDEPEIIAEYKELLPHIFQKIPPLDLAPRQILGPQPPLQDDPSQRYMRFMALEGQLALRIDERVISSEILVLGRPQLKERPELVSVSLWKTGRLSKNQSEVWTETEVLEIRLVKARASVAKLIAAIPHAESPRSRGPVSNRGWIVRAYEELLKDDKIDFNSSFEANIPRIKSVAQSLRGGDPNARGFGPSSIYDELSGRFKQDAETRGFSRKHAKV